MDYLSVIQMLNACHGPAGDERQIAATIQGLAEPYADDCRIDTLGNLIVHKKGPGPKVLFAAHMDSIGLIVTHIDKDGYLSFGKLGGIHPESILHTPFRFKNGVCGLVALRQGVALKDMTVNDLYLDIGAKATWVMMSLFTKAGESKLVEALSYPVTGLGCVSRIYTEVAVFELRDSKVFVRSTHGISFDQLAAKVPVELTKA